MRRLGIGIITRSKMAHNLTITWVVFLNPQGLSLILMHFSRYYCSSRSDKKPITPMLDWSTEIRRERERSAALGWRRWYQETIPHLKKTRIWQFPNTVTISRCQTVLHFKAGISLFVRRFLVFQWRCSHPHLPFRGLYLKSYYNLISILLPMIFGWICS